MRLDIQFVGVAANEILIDRIYEHLEEMLGTRVEIVDAVQLKIGENAEGLQSGIANGHGIIVLSDGREIVARTESAKLMTLIDACIEKLDEHFKEKTASTTTFGEIANAFIPNLFSVR